MRQVKTALDMGKAAGTDWKADIAGALDWWREAGVDHDFLDAGHGWLEEPEQAVASPTSAPRAAVQVATPPETPPPPSLGGDRGAWPATLEKFAAWWLEEPTLDTGGMGPRIPPRGKPGARLMVLVPEPEAEDQDSLLSGPQGKLLDAMLAAMNIAADDAYLASALPRHTPLADWQALGAAGLAEITAHHIALAAPQRILVLGRNILPLLGHEPAQDPAALREFNHEGGSVAMMAAGSLENLLLQPGRRAIFWRRWLDWTG